LLGSAAGLFYILDHENGRTALWSGGHGWLYRRTPFRTRARFRCLCAELQSIDPDVSHSILTLVR
jgi:hypothetical protein